MNTDLSRSHSWHTQSLLRFIENEDLFITLNHSCADISYSYCNTYTNAFSIIDHIFVSQSLNGYIHKYYSICDEVDNQSDHVPIVIAFQIELEHSLLTSNLHKVRTSWKKANSDDISEYKSNLDDCLSRIMLPYDCLHCTDVLCTNINDLYMRTNCLLSDFSFSECSTLSHLFNTYCMNIYGSPLWKYYDKKLLELFYVAWRKSLRRVWNISNVTHHNLLPYIHNCHPIEVILEKRCIKFVWSLFNSNYALYSNILRLSLQNGNSTMGENVRYLMHKYGIVNSDWSQNINILYSKVESYSNRLLNIEHKCTSSVIRELCETRDSCNTQFFERKELLYLIEMLCTN